VFDQLGAADTIGDFEHGIDQIVVDSSAFAGLADFASLGEFISGDGVSLGPVNGDPTLLYDVRTGVLSFDADGVGAFNAVEIALLGNRAVLTESDFQFI
jgi:hypothetical protein